MAKKGNRPYIMPGRLFAATLGLFALTLTTSVAATYAWFQVRDFARLDQISMSLHDDSVLEIGYKDHEGKMVYKQGLNESDFRIIDEHYDENTYLKDVSSMYGGLWLNKEVDPDEKTPILRLPYAKEETTTITSPATKGFVQIETYFRCSSPCHLYLDKDTKAVPIERWNKELAKQTNYTEEELNAVLDCVRISFYSKEGFHIAEPNVETSSHTKFGGPLQAKTLDGYYDQVDGKETMYGEYSGIPSYLPAPEEDLIPYEDDSAFHAKHKAGVEILDVSSVDIAEEKTVPLKDFLYQGGPTAKEAICLGTLSPNEDYRLVISVYIEGWDLDLTDALATGKFRLDLSFVGLMDI